MATDFIRRLTLVRHANADQDSEVRDFERPLNRKGRGEAEEIAKRLLARDWIPDRILASAAVRTRETAEIFARILNVPARLLQADDSLYLADGEQLLSAIRSAGPRVGHLLLIAHNPGISAAAIALAPEAISSDLPTCGLLTMQVTCAKWSLIDRRGVRDPERDAPKKLFG